MALEWRAQQAHEQRRVDAKVEALNEDSDPTGQHDGSPHGQPAGAATAPQGESGPAFDLSEVEVSALAWTLVDVMVVKFMGARFALDDAEKMKLAVATVPVLKKYFPEGVQLAPEFALAAVGVAVYGPKLLSPAPSPAPSPASPSGPVATLERVA